MRDNEAKSRAEQLVKKIRPYADRGNDDSDSNELYSAKRIALIVVSEIWVGINENFHAHPDKPALSERKWNEAKDFWTEVKKEIELL